MGPANYLAVGRCEAFGVKSIGGPHGAGLLAPPGDQMGSKVKFGDNGPVSLR